MQKIHLVCGQPGAGKTTFARALAEDTKGIHLLMDECMKPLSFPDLQDVSFMKCVVEPKALKCAASLLEKATYHLSQGQDVVLDLATFEKRHRDSVRQWARAIDTELILYWVRANQLTRRKRVLERNNGRGSSYSFQVPNWVFDYMEAKFEAPTEAESAILVDRDG